MEHNCGVFGIYSNKNCSNDIFLGIDFLQHRGQVYCGISTYDNGDLKLISHHDRVGTSFDEIELNYLSGDYGIGHVSLRDRQPIRLETKSGNFTSCFSGNILNGKELFSDLKKRGHSFSTDTHLELISKIIGEGKDLVDGITLMANRVLGSFTLLILNSKGIYVARDPYGLRPLILGKGDGKYVVASESRAIQSLDMEIVRDVEPGEILLINKDGFHTIEKIPSKRTAYCAFEWAYIASIDSKIDGLYVKEARSNLGEKLAERDEKEGKIKADSVAAVPMSGIGHALGYHKRSKIQYQEVFLYNRYSDRSYTLQTQKARDMMAKRKIAVLKQAVEGKKIILCDDSIVRGTQIKNKVRELKKAGADEVHVRIACPPLMHPCPYTISTRTYKELIARTHIKEGEIDSIEKLNLVENEVAKFIDADSVKFNTLDDFVDALGIEKEKLCLQCWDGKLTIEK